MNLIANCHPKIGKRHAWGTAVTADQTRTPAGKHSFTCPGFFKHSVPNRACIFQICRSERELPKTPALLLLRAAFNLGSTMPQMQLCFT